MNLNLNLNLNLICFFMKNQVFLPILFLLTLLVYQVQAQCPSGNTILASQADVDSFVATYPMCQDLSGDLTIGGTSQGSLSDITDISGLQLTSIGGSLRIQHNPLLSSLNGLDMLTSVNAAVSIFNNASLMDLTGLDALTFIGKNLSILNNNALTSLTGLNALTNVVSINISFNPMLMSLTGLEGITAISGFLNIENNGITSMTGLDNLESVGGDVEIRENINLMNLNGLENLAVIQGGFYIFANYQLTTIEALTSLVDVCGQFQMFKHAVTDCAVAIMCMLTQDGNFDQFVQTDGTDCGTAAQIMAQVQAANLDCDAAEAAAVVCNPLSTELVNIDVRLEGRTAVLTWETATETNNQGFEIQRSRDGFEWQTLSWQEGSGTSNALSTYAYTDYNTYRGINYYRLLQLDFNGASAYSPAVSITTTAVNTIDVYPNPASDFLIVSGLDGRTMDEVAIHDLNGKEVLRLTDTNNMIDVSNLQPGMYVAVIIAGFDEKFIKLMIE